MRMEKLKKDNRKKIIIGVSIVVLIIMGVVGFVRTKAKYKYIAEYPLVSGTIHYKSGDVSLLAINIQNADGSYSEANNFPTSGYTINSEKSYCAVSTESGNVRQDVKLSYMDNTLIVNGLKEKGTKCFLYFDKGVCDEACQIILSKNNIDNSRSSGEITGIFAEDTNGRIFNATDDDGTTYFFAGSNPNNFVKFAGYYWRIIRINGDGTVRLIYNGSSTDQLGEGTQIGTSAFNESVGDNAYVGYMYGTPGSDNYNDTHANINDSTIKKVVDKWYQDNLLNTEYEKYIDINAGFCGDRQTKANVRVDFGDLGYGGNGTTYAATGRVVENGIYKTLQSPSLKCTNKSNDLYTVSSSKQGNKALTYPIGLMTFDETLYAGAFVNVSNPNYWLVTNNQYWLMTPNAYSNYSHLLDVWLVWTDGGQGDWGAANSSYGVRPVINLKADTIMSGSGTSTDPFVVAL